MAATAYDDFPAGSPAGLLAAVRGQHELETAATTEKFRLAADWADLHPVESIGQAARLDGTEGELAIAGPGAPLVAEFCVAELALALGMSTDAGRAYLGDAIEVRHRLPRLWAQVLAGRVPVWRARRLAQSTRSLPFEAATYVDRHLAAVAGTCSFAQLERTVEDARARFDPVEAEHRRLLAAEHRRLTFTPTRCPPTGRCASTGSWTWPTPWTSTTPWLMAPNSSGPWAPRDPGRAAGDGRRRPGPRPARPCLHRRTGPA